MQGRSFDEYAAPLFLAWQLTNRCSARCIACCEESGPDKAWADELTRAEALDLARRIARFRYSLRRLWRRRAAVGAPHCWDIFERLAAAGVSLKIETDGSRIDDAAADRIASLAIQCVQISVDGATAATHDRVRPGLDLRRGDRRDRAPRSARPARRSSCSCPRATTCTRSCPRSISRRRSAARRS